MALSLQISAAVRTFFSCPGAHWLQELLDPAALPSPLSSLSGAFWKAELRPGPHRLQASMPQTGSAGPGGNQRLFPNSLRAWSDPSSRWTDLGYLSSDDCAPDAQVEGGSPKGNGVLLPEKVGTDAQWAKKSQPPWASADSRALRDRGRGRGLGAQPTASSAGQFSSL